MLLQLPIDILVNILKMLQLPDLYIVVQTCKTLKELVINDNTIWRYVCRNKLILNHSKSTFKMSYAELCRISNNWCKGIFRTKMMTHHRVNFMPWLSYHDFQTLILSTGSQLHCYQTNKRGLPFVKDILWKLDVPTIQRNDIRTNDVSRFVIKNGFIICGNRDGGAAVYDWENIKQKPSLICHIKNCHEAGTLEVSAVELLDHHKSILATGSNDSPHLLLWRWQSGNNSQDNYTADNILDVVINDGAGVRCMSVEESSKKLAIGLNGNSKPLLIDTNIGKLLMTAETTVNFQQVVRDIHWHNENTIVYITHSGFVKLMDTRSYKTIYKMRDPFHSTLYCVKSDQKNALVAGSSEYSRCVLFDVRNSSKHMQMYFTSKRPSPVYCLDFDTTKLLSAVDRGVSVVNFNVSSDVEKKDYSYIYLT